MRIYRVERHPSGRHTLTAQDDGDKNKRDLRGDLFGNMDAASFYRAVALELAEAAKANIAFEYRDTAN